MFIEDQQPGLFQAGTRREQLGEHVLAGAALFEHLPESPDLPFNPRQAVLQLFLV